MVRGRSCKGQGPTRKATAGSQRTATLASLTVGQRKAFVVKGAAVNGHAAGAVVSGDVAGLRHEPGNDAMEARAPAEARGRGERGRAATAKHTHRHTVCAALPNVRTHPQWGGGQ